MTSAGNSPGESASLSGQSLVSTPGDLAAVRELYLDLMKRTLTRAIDEENDFVLAADALGQQNLKKRAVTVAARALSLVNLEMVLKRPYDAEKRLNGHDWPSRAESMIGLKRMDNIQECAEDVLANNVPGDFIETGVWRGGAVIFMRAILKAYHEQNRVVWAADSFEGLPKPDPKRFPADKGDQLYTAPVLSVGVDQVRHNFDRYNLLDDQVRFLVGWFKDTLPTAPIEKLALLRLDGDMYESTMDAISVLYPKLSKGGYCIVDDYGNIPGCEKAITDFRSEHGITDEIRDIDGRGIYWKCSQTWPAG